MKKFSKHTPEQIVAKLEKADKLTAAGSSTRPLSEFHTTCRVFVSSEGFIALHHEREHFRSSEGPLKGV
ncbi:hypothetical protein CHEID_06730 [Corynebacterium heidelbergense]|nr:hypothetical protein CHEID_06730 [Corynebacterium heidelbergense]